MLSIAFYAEILYKRDFFDLYKTFRIQVDPSNCCIYLSSARLQFNVYFVILISIGKLVNGGFQSESLEAFYIKLFFTKVALCHQGALF